MTTVYGTEFGRSFFGKTGVIGRVETTQTGNVAVSVGHLNEMGWEKTAHVTLTRDEAIACGAEIALAGARAKFQEGVEVTDARALGVVLALTLGWDGAAICEAFAAALHDANFHPEAEAALALVA